MSGMNVLIACEESQEVCKAFRALGHRAFSCDIQDCSGGHPEWHIKGDCLPLLNGNCSFQTADTHTHTGRALGFTDSPSAVYRPCRVRCPVVQRKTKRPSAAKGRCVFYALCSCRVRQDRRGKPCWDYVHSLRETYADYTAVYVRRTRTKNNLFVA